MNKLDLLKLAENQDEEAFDEREVEENINSKNKNFKSDYENFYDDVKQPNKYIKEDW